MGVKGNSGGKKGRSGRKSKAEELGVQEWFDKNLSNNSRVKILNRLVEIAEGDDPKAAVSAATMLFNYSFGKPTEKHEVAGKGGGPIETIATVIVIPDNGRDKN